MSAEHQRLAVNATRKIPLEQWGPYLSERQWGTVREDYSQHGDAWNYITHDRCNGILFYYCIPVLAVKSGVGEKYSFLILSITTS